MPTMRESARRCSWPRSDRWHRSTQSGRHSRPGCSPSPATAAATEWASRSVLDRLVALIAPPDFNDCLTNSMPPTSRGRLMMSSAIDLGTGATVPKEPGSRLNLWNDLILPTLLFTALGGMTWAVRGCSGFGAWKGCVFAGVTWGAAWWYLAYDPRREQSRRYASPWIVAALTFGIGMAGIQGWMQWPSLFE